MRSLSNLYHIFDRYLLSRAKKASVKIPKKVGKYKVVDVLLKEEFSDTAVLKIKNLSGEFFVVKYWQGSHKNYSFDSLKREHHIYKILDRIYYSKDFKKQNYKVKLPKLVEYVENSRESYLILEYINGQTLEFSGSKMALNGLKEINEFLKEVGKHATKDEMKFLGKKSYWYHIALFPLFVFKAVLSNPKELKSIMLGVVRYLFLITRQKEKNVLVHGDLNLKNIIVSKDIYYPIDFEFTRYEPYEYSLANTLRYVWANKKNKKIYTSYIQKEIKNEKINAKILSSLITIHGTQGLMATNFSEKDIKSISNYLCNAPLNFYSLSQQIKSFTYKLVYFLNYLPIFKRGPVALCYHSFAGNNDRYSISVKEFEKQMEIVSKTDGFISLKDIGNKNLKKGVLVTIDDGFKSVLKISPVVKRLKIPVLLFVLSNPKEANRKELNTYEKLLTWSDIRTLRKAGWEIGSHSATHTSFESLNGQSLINEIKEAKKILEKKVDSNISYFAYPKGSFSQRSANFVKQCGFKYGFSVLPGNLNSYKDKYTMPRTIIDSTHHSYDFPYLYSDSWFMIRKLTAPLKIWEKISQ